MSQSPLKSFFIMCSLIVLSIFNDFSYANTIINKLENNKVTIHIGIYAPFSGQSAFIGRNVLAAMEMARDQLKSSNINYSFYTLDVIPERNNVISTVQKFIDTHHVNVLLTEGSANGLLIARLAKKNNIIHFSMASDPAIADGNNNFLAWSSADEQANVLVNELKRKQIHQLAIITSNNPAVTALTEHVVKQLKTPNSSISIASYEEFKSGSKDFSGLIKKMTPKKADLYFIMATPEEIDLIQSGMKAAHINTPITSIVDRVTPTLMQVFDGQWYIDTHEMKPDFINQYKDIYINHPVTEAGYAYDIFCALHQSVTTALKKNTPFSTQEVAIYLRSFGSKNGVMGAFNLNQEGVLYTKSEVKTIQNGQVHTV